MFQLSSPIRQRSETGLLFILMRNLWQALVVTAVLAAVWTIGATGNKPAPVNSAHYEKATLAGGCFWGLQETLRWIPGVIKTTVGYTGGTTPNPTYEQVAAGKTGHTEAVEVIFDPARLSYEQLLADFLSARNPARQSTRVGNPHRLAIFYHDAGQRQTAERMLDKINQSGKWNSPVILEITRATGFYPAEAYHQDYYRKISAAQTCRLEQD
jgi:methionine-S-sulfoxide reductase